MHGGAAPQVRRAARESLNADLASRLLASLHGDWQLDSRIGPRRWSPYGLLPANTRERYLDDQRRLEIENDPLLSAARDLILRTPA